MITRAFFIILIIFIVFLRLVRGLGIYRALKKLKSRLLRAKKILVENFFLIAFVRLEEKLMAQYTANIYLSDLGRKVESSFGLYIDGFLDSLFSGILPIAILFGLGIDEGS